MFDTITLSYLERLSTFNATVTIHSINESQTDVEFVDFCHITTLSSITYLKLEKHHIWLVLSMFKTKTFEKIGTQIYINLWL